MSRKQIEDAINISAGKNDNYRQICSNSLFFSCGGEFIVRDRGDCLIIAKPTIDNNAINSRRRFSKNKTNWYYCQLPCQLPFGKYFFDKKESTEDCKVIYFTKE